MVATRDAHTTSAYSFVTGKSFIDPATISCDEWVQIIREAVKLLPINYLRGFKQVIPILQGDSLAVKRDGPWSTILEGHTESPSQELKSLGVCLSCTDVNAQFPSSWATAPTRYTRRWDEDLLPITTKVLLLTRDGTFLYLTATWDPLPVWAHDSMSSTPFHFSYVVDTNSIVVKKITNDVELSDLLSTHKVSYRIGILHRLYSAIRETADDIGGQYDRALITQHRMEGYLTRIGEFG